MVKLPDKRQTQFERLSPRLGRAKAIVAIARKMLVVVWQILTYRVADNQAQSEKVAGKLMRWGYLIRPKGRGD